MCALLRRVSRSGTPKVTTWEEVHLVVADLCLSVEVRGKRKELTFQEAGFEDKRRGAVPDRLRRLLKMLAVHGGTLPSAPKGSPNRLKQEVNLLGKRLTNLLHIPGRPFKDASVTHRYEAVFRISTTEGLRFPTPNGLTWEQVMIEEIRPGTIAISADLVAP